RNHLVSPDAAGPRGPADSIECPKNWMLGASRLTVGVAPVALRLANGLVFEHPCNAGFFRRLSCFGFGARRGIDGCLSLGGFGCPALGLVAFHLFALKTPLFPGRGDSRPFRLSRQSGGFTDSPCR